MLEEAVSGVLFGAGTGGLVRTVLDVGLGDNGFDLSKDGGESIGLLCADGGGEDFFVSEDGGNLFGWEGAAEVGEGGICAVEGLEDPSRTGNDPWVVTAEGLDEKSFSIFPAY